MSFEAEQFNPKFEEPKHAPDDLVSQRKELEERVIEVLTQLGIPAKKIAKSGSFINELVNYGMASADEEIGNLLIKYIRKYYDNDQVAAGKLINAGQTDLFFEHAQKFQDIDNNKIMVELIATKDYSALAVNIDKLAESDEQKKRIWQLLFERKAYVDLVNNCDKFPDVDFPALTEELLKSNLDSYVGKVLPKLWGNYLHSVIDKLIDKGRFLSIPAGEINQLSYGLKEDIISKLISKNKFDDFRYLINTVGILSGIPNWHHSVPAIYYLTSKKYDEFGSDLAQFENLGVHFAEKLIENNNGQRVVNNLKSFEPESHDAIAVFLIKHSQGDLVLENWDKFGQLKVKEIAHLLAMYNQGRVILDNFDRFKDVIDAKTAVLLFRSLPKEFLERLEDLKNVNYQEFIDDLINQYEFSNVSYYLFDHLDKLKIDHSKLALAIIKNNGEGVDLALAKLHNLNNQVAEVLISKLNFKFILNNLDNFTNLNYLHLAQAVIENNRVENLRLLSSCLDRFSLPKEMYEALLNGLINAGRGNTDRLAEDINKYKGIDKDKFVDMVIKRGGGANIINNIGNFPEASLQDLLDKMYNADNSGGVDALLGLTVDFEYSPAQILNMLWHKQWYGVILNHLEIFPDVNQQELLNKMVHRRDLDKIEKNWHKLNKVNPKEFFKLLSEEADKRVDDDIVDFVIRNYLKFGLTLDVLVKEMTIGKSGPLFVQRIKKDYNFFYRDFKAIGESLRLWGHNESLVRNLEIFPDIDHNDLLKNLLAGLEFTLIIKCLDKFKGIDYNWLINEIVLPQSKSQLPRALDLSLSKFSNLNNESAKKIMEFYDDGLIQVVTHQDSFDNLDLKTLGTTAFQAGKYKDLAIYFELFPNIDEEALINKLLESNDAQTVINNVERFNKVDHNSLMVRLIDSFTAVPGGKELAKDYNLKKFKNLDKAIAKRLINLYPDGFKAVFENMDSFTDLDDKTLGEFAFELGNYDDLAKNLDKFPDIDSQTLIDKLIENRQPSIITIYLEKFKNIDHNQLFGRLLATFTNIGIPTAGDFHLENFKNLDIKFADTLIERYDDGFRQVILNFGSFSNESENKVLMAMKEKMPAEYLTKNIYLMSKDIYNNGSQAGVAEKFKIKSPGDAGLNELMRYFRKFTKELVSENSKDNLKADLSEPALRDYLKAIVHYEDSQWGNHKDKEFSDTIENYLQAEFLPMAPEYQASKELKIKKIDQEAISNFVHTQEFLNRYEEILADIKIAQKLLSEPSGLQILQYSLKSEAEKILTNLKNNLSAQTNPKAIKNLEKTISDFEALNFSSVVDLESLLPILQGISVLAKGEEGRELRKLIREGVFYSNYKFNDVFAQENLDNFIVKEPTVNQLTWVIDFVEHIVNKENLSKFFKDAKVSKNFRDIISSRELQESLQRWQNQDTKGTMSMQFVPARNVLTEFSGHVADACWASAYISILQNFPNFTSLFFVQNPESAKDFSLAGASFLIEAKTLAGQDVMIVRGLNPRENVINQLSAEDFINQLIEYLKPIAKARNIKKIIIPLTGSGASMTNRPALAGYLGKLLASRPVIKLAGEPNASFNNYDISNNCRLLAEVE